MCTIEQNLRATSTWLHGRCAECEAEGRGPRFRFVIVDGVEIRLRAPRAVTHNASVVRESEEWLVHLQRYLVCVHFARPYLRLGLVLRLRSLE
jgi:hypothetical protein